jgi:alpha-amylase
MATKFFSDGAVHAYFNPYESPYDAFMNYMNVLSDFEIRLNRCFPDTAEQDQIFKLGTQVIERDMLIEKQSEEIEKLKRKVARIKPAARSAAKKTVKPSELIIEWSRSEKKAAEKTKSPGRKKPLKAAGDQIIKKPVKTAKEKTTPKKASSEKKPSPKKVNSAKKPGIKGKVPRQKKSI